MCFSYVPVRGSQDLKCSACHASYSEHWPRNHGCPKGGAKFASSYTCSCTGCYNDHKTVFETRPEREQQGRPVDAGWMEQAAREGLPVCHLGGILGFSSLADGIDRAYAGLEGEAVVLASGANAGDVGASRWMQRMQLEDEVNTAAALGGRAAGHQALRQVQARQRPPQRASSSGSGAGLPQRRALSQGPPANVASGSTAQPGRPNIHTLADAQAPSSSRSAAASSNSTSGTGAKPPRVPGASGASRRSASATTAASAQIISPTVPSGGRRVGGARQTQNDAEAMRRARLAKFEG